MSDEPATIDPDAEATAEEVERDVEETVDALEALLRAFVELHPDDAARAFETLPPTEAARLVRNLPLEEVVELATRLSATVVVPLLEALDRPRAAEVLRHMSPRSATSLLQQFDDDDREGVLAAMPAETAKPLRDLLQYPGDTAGGMMEPRVASFRIDLTVQQAITKIRRTPREALHYLYVTDREGRLLGVLNMRDLLLANPRDGLETLVRRNVLTVKDVMPREEVVNVMRERGFLALPVVDFEDRLVGVVTHDDALHASQLEGFEDMQMSVGVGADERALSPVSTVVRNRLPWLLVNLGTAFLAAAVVGLFEGMIARVAALAVLLPVVAGQGGNAGAQSLAIVMRGLALREVIPGTRYRVVVKEAMAGFFNGCAVAVVTAGGVFAWRMIAGDTTGVAAGLSLVIGLAMVVNMVAATVAGTTLPFVLRALGQDPARSASIFLTTVTDIVGFASFLGLAAIFASLLGV